MVWCVWCECGCGVVEWRLLVKMKQGPGGVDKRNDDRPPRMRLGGPVVGAWWVRDVTRPHTDRHT